MDHLPKAVGVYWTRAALFSAANAEVFMVLRPMSLMRLNLEARNMERLKSVAEREAG